MRRKNTKRRTMRTNTRSKAMFCLYIYLEKTLEEWLFNVIAR